MTHMTQNKTNTTTCLDDNSQMQLHDFVSDQPVQFTDKKLLPKTTKANRSDATDLEAQAKAIIAQDPATPFNAELDTPAGTVTMCHVSKCNITTDKKMDVCQFNLANCGYKASIGCKKPFCPDHRA